MRIFITGIDEADGTFITKTEFLEKWRDAPEMITEVYNFDTEENVLHYLAREGKIDVLRVSQAPSSLKFSIFPQRFSR